MRSKRSRSRRNLSSQANTRSIVRKRSSKMAGSKIALRPRFGCFPPRGLGLMLGTNAAVEDRLAVGPAVVDAVEADDGALKVHARLPGDAHHVEHRLPQQRRFVAIAWCRHERRDHVTMAVAEGDDFVALHLLVPAESKVVAALFRRRRRAVAMNDRRIEAAVLMKPRHRAGEDGVHAAIVHPPPPDTVNARVVRFRLAFVI